MATLWLVVGFAAQAMFTARFLVQWIASERKRQSTIPVAFWYLSLAGGVMLLAYALWRRDPVFVIGQGAGLVVYVRNIVLLRRAAHDAGTGPVEPRPLFALRRAAPWLALAALAAVMAIAFQGTRGLTEPDEGRYAEVAREMLVSGDYISPQLDFRPHFTKPPLTYWCIAASMKLFGRSEWSVRLFLSLAFFFTVLLVARTGADLWGRRTGLLAGLVYATSLTPFIGASIVTPDTLLVLWLALATWAFLRGRSASGAGRWGWPALTGVAFGLAFLSKGPPALLFLPAMFAAARFFGPRRGRAPVLNATGIAGFLVLGLGWYALVALRHEGLLDYWWKDEIVGRIAGVHHRNPEWYGPFAIYLPVLTLGAFPWALAWPRLLRGMRSRLAPGGWREKARRAPVMATLALLALVPLVVLSLSRSRLPLYVLPLFVPLALATARGLVVSVPAVSTTRLVPAIGAWMPRLAAWCAVLIVARLVYATFPGDADARRLYAALPDAPDAEIVVDDGRAHNGLVFYSGKPLLYATSAITPDPGETTLDREIAEVAAPAGPPHLFLVRPEEARDLQTRLSEAGAVTVETRDLHHLFAILTRGRTPAAGARDAGANAGADKNPAARRSPRPAPASEAHGG